MNLTYLLSKELVDKLIAERRESCKIDAKVVVERLAELALADIHQYIEVREQEVMKTKKKKVVENTLLLRDLNKVITHPIKEMKKTKDGLSFKLEDKTRALDMLGRHFGLWKDDKDAGVMSEFGKVVAEIMSKKREADQGGKPADK